MNKIIGLVFCLIFTGCSTLGTYNPATGRSEFILIPTSEEVLMGQSIHAQILTENQLSTNEESLARVDRVGQRLALLSDRQDYPYHFFLIEKDEFNAFTTPGGNIYFYTGLLNHLETDDQVASVLAHEIGHCAARHTVKKFQAALGYNLLGSIIFSQFEMGAIAQKIAGLSSNAVMNIVFSAYGRQDEFEADRLGIKYMYLAGYKLEAMGETFEILKKGSKEEGPPLILRSHPYLEDRIEAAKKEIETVEAKYGR